MTGYFRRRDSLDGDGDDDGYCHGIAVAAIELVRHIRRLLLVDHTSGQEHLCVCANRRVLNVRVWIVPKID